MLSHMENASNEYIGKAHIVSFSEIWFVAAPLQQTTSQPVLREMSTPSGLYVDRPAAIL